MTSITGDSADPNVPGVHGSHSSTGAGVFAESEIGPGIHAVSRGTDPKQEGVAVFAEAVGAAVIGNSQNWVGVVGFTTSTTGGVGVMGQGAGGATGVFGEADSGIGVHGITNSGEAAIRGEHKAAGFAGFFEGKVGITHDLSVTGALNVQGSDVLQRIGTLEQQASGTAQLGTQISALEQKIAEVQAQLNSLQNQVNTAISSVNSAIDILNGRVTQTEIAINAIEAALAGG